MQKRSIIWILFLSIFCVLLFIVKTYPPEEHHFYPKCVFYVLTGWKCSGCGNFRASHALLNGAFKTAWNYNASLFFLLPYFSLGFITQLWMNKYEWAKKTYLFLFNGFFVYILIIGLVIFTVVRNIYSF